MDGNLVLWAVLMSLVLFVALATSFLGGMTIGMRIGSGGTRSLFGAVKGASFQAPDPEWGYPDESGGSESVQDMMRRTFGAGWSEQPADVPQGTKQAAQEYDTAMKAVDGQVKRFLDSTVFGTGPRRARSGEAEDDE